MKLLNTIRIMLVYVLVNTAQAQVFTKTLDLTTGADQLRVIAITILSEARGEGDEGMRRVAKVIQNRARKHRSNAAVECLKPYQFSWWNSKPSRTACLKLLADINSDYALFLASDILSGKDVKPLFEATHFHSGEPPKWAHSNKMRFLGQYKGHAFYQEL